MRIQSDKPQPPQSALTELGRIAVGEKVERSGQVVPSSIDSFRIRGDHAETVHKIYGETITELPILFYSDQEELVCNERLEIRTADGKLFGYGDNQTFHIWNDELKKYAVTTTERRPQIMDETVAFVQKNLPPGKAKLIRWLPVLTLRFVIRDIPLLGYWQFSTRAVQTTIPNLRNKFDEYKKLFGSVQYLPFLLKVKKVKTNKPGMVYQYPIVDLVPQFSFETAHRLARYLRENPNADASRWLSEQGEKPEQLPSSAE
ncbi:recombination directionality factor [Larkinella rosea]|uniref:Uncharacterized protein n=1 Tax=Larkinella rosea TaxID=2025312 RepID=A0A3P1BZI0_9BACT|nr:hypothetical protein [Larkinella rosea]RRB06560.1 hypothetical protein EHT25_01815 [Larkinella rosea]